MWMFLTIEAVKKGIKSKKKLCRQLYSWYFETFGWMNKFFFAHKWNEAWLLVINCYIRLASRVAEQLQTCDLRKLGNIREILKLHRLIS